MSIRSSLQSMGLTAVASLMAWGVLPASPVRAAGSSVAKGAAEVAVPNTLREEFVSKVNGHRYTISVALPFTAAPTKGYAVLYVLDGDMYFASATEAVRVLGGAGVVVVGIGYPNDPLFAKAVSIQRGPLPAYLADLPLSRSALYLERTYDLTLPASDADLEAQAMPGTPRQRSRNVGGIDDFLKIIETEIKPRVSAVAPVDAGNQALFGHSFGGLAALHALFVEPEAFRTFIIASPSIFWNSKKVLADEARFAAAVNSGRAQPRVLVAVGGEESTPVRFPVSWGVDNAAAEAYQRKIRMVEDAIELVTSLKALHGGSGFRVEDCVIFDKEGHSDSPWPALARGIRFAFDSEQW